MSKTEDDFKTGDAVKRVKAKASATEKAESETEAVTNYLKPWNYVEKERLSFSMTSSKNQGAKRLTDTFSNVPVHLMITFRGSYPAVNIKARKF